MSESVSAKAATAIAQVIESQFTDKFWSAIMGLCESQVSCDDMAVLVFQKGRQPELLYYQGKKAERKLVTDVYLQGLYVLDPFFQAAINKQLYGFQNLEQVAPKGFYQGDLYELYYKASKIQDEVGYIYAPEADSVLFISMSRMDESPVFNEKELQMLANLNPIIDAWVKQFWQGYESGSDDSVLHTRIIEILHAFGASMLTDREQEVIQRILRGYSAQAIADDLEISINTVKLHRKNAYAKLDIASQNELFHLFLDSLSCVKDSGLTDPLIAYMSVPGG